MVVTHIHPTSFLCGMDKKPLIKLWQDAQAAKRGFIRTVSDIELDYMRKHSRGPDISFIWLDELLIGIQVVDGNKRCIYYDEDLRSVERRNPNKPAEPKQKDGTRKLARSRARV